MGKAKVVKKRPAMRVQWQENKGGDNQHHDSQGLYPTATPPPGVKVALVVGALGRLHAALPKGQVKVGTGAHARAVTWAQARPPGGVTGVMSWSFYFDVQNPGNCMRFDIENLVGHNLRA